MFEQIMLAYCITFTYAVITEMLTVISRD